jgi:hypothetical protein
MNRSIYLSIALHPRKGRRMTVNRPFNLNPNHIGFSKPCDFGDDRFDLAPLRFAGSGPGPFWRAPDADRENTLGYSWPPHLYQGDSKLEENSGSVNARIGPGGSVDFASRSSNQ